MSLCSVVRFHLVQLLLLVDRVEDAPWVILGCHPAIYGQLLSTLRPGFGPHYVDALQRDGSVRLLTLEHVPQIEVASEATVREAAVRHFRDTEAGFGLAHDPEKCATFQESPLLGGMCVCGTSKAVHKRRTEQCRTVAEALEGWVLGSWSLRWEGESRVLRAIDGGPASALGLIKGKLPADELPPDLEGGAS